jgi:hypothetical protein
VGVAFIDTETLGLQARTHAIWEIAIIIPDGPDAGEHLWQQSVRSWLERARPGRPGHQRLPRPVRRVERPRVARVDRQVHAPPRGPTSRWGGPLVRRGTAPPSGVDLPRGGRADAVALPPDRRGGSRRRLPQVDGRLPRPTSPGGQVGGPHLAVVVRRPVASPRRRPTGRRRPSHRAGRCPMGEGHLRADHGGGDDLDDVPADRDVAGGPHDNPQTDAVRCFVEVDPRDARP